MKPHAALVYEPLDVLHAPVDILLRFILKIRKTTIRTNPHTDINKFMCLRMYMGMSVYIIYIHYIYYTSSACIL